jgi:hypothetical protein
MKRSTYSLATVFLVVAIVGISAASLRGLWVRVEGGKSSEPYVAVAVAAFGGAIFGFALAVWTRTDSIFHPRNMTRMGLLSMFGVVLGAAVGAQATAQVGWGVLLFIPPLMIGCAAMVAFNRRRRQRKWQQASSATSNQEADHRASVHPLDRLDDVETRQADGDPDVAVADSER